LTLSSLQNIPRHALHDPPALHPAIALMHTRCIKMRPRARVPQAVQRHAPARARRRVHPSRRRQEAVPRVLRTAPHRIGGGVEVVLVRGVEEAVQRGEPRTAGKLG
jgi:hypothetical protein